MPYPIRMHCKYGHAMTAENTYRRPGTEGRACRTCLNARCLAYGRANREKLNARARERYAEGKRKGRKTDPIYGRRHHLRKKYGLSVEQYDAMHAAQKGRCAVCRKPEIQGRFLSVDHCHKTGKVRGLLCIRCNSGIGLIDAGLMHQALRYIAEAA